MFDKLRTRWKWRSSSAVLEGTAAVPIAPVTESEMSPQRYKREKGFSMATEALDPTPEMQAHNALVDREYYAAIDRLRQATIDGTFFPKGFTTRGVEVVKALVGPPQCLSPQQAVVELAKREDHGELIAWHLVMAQQRSENVSPTHYQIPPDPTPEQVAANVRQNNQHREDDAVTRAAEALTSTDRRMATLETVVGATPVELVERHGQIRAGMLFRRTKLDFLHLDWADTATVEAALTALKTFEAGQQEKRP